MCGIAGIYNFNGSPVDKKCIQQMNELIHYRGPDDEGYVFLNTQSNKAQSFIGKDSDQKLIGMMKNISEANIDHENLAMSFRRLAIVDLSIAGHQPMSDSTDRYWMVFNGEIYNFIELREELSSMGYVFHSNGDSEVLLNAYKAWGTECLQRFIGMFALVIWDPNEKIIFGARDRFGVKPLNYYVDKDKFIWASEEKQIIASHLIDLKFNVDALSSFFLCNQLYVKNETFLSNIKQLPPGHYFQVSKDKFEIKKYWDINPDNDNRHLSVQQKDQRFKELFYSAVQLRLRSDVPIGIALSGGLDSSSIAMVSKNLIPNVVKTFSVYYDIDKKFDEREFIQAVISCGGFDPVYYTQDEQINLEAIRNWTFHQDGPTSGASPYSAYLNYKNVRKSGITVLLNGQGGDEILGGYPYYFKYLVSDEIKSFQFGELLRNLRSWTKDYSLGFAGMQLISGLLPYLVQTSTLLKLENRKYCTPALYPNLAVNTEYTFDKKFNNIFNQSLYRTLRSTMIPHLLHWEDRNSMACRIESRVPFLDHRLVEFMYSLPNNDKIKDGTTKIILRRALSDILPVKIKERKDKKGFGTPTDLWTSGLINNQIKDLLHSQSMKERSIWDIEKIKTAFKRNTFGENELWKILTTELFMESFETLNRKSV